MQLAARPERVARATAPLVVLAFLTNAAIVGTAIQAFNVPATISSLDFPALIASSVFPVLGNAFGFFMSYRKVSSASLPLFLGIGVVITTVFLVLAVLDYGDHDDVGQFVTAVLVTLAPTVITVVALLRRKHKLVAPVAHAGLSAAPAGGGIPPLGSTPPAGGGIPPLGSAPAAGAGIPPLGSAPAAGGGIPPLGSAPPAGGAIPPLGSAPPVRGAIPPLGAPPPPAPTPSAGAPVDASATRAWTPAQLGSAGQGDAPRSGPADANPHRTGVWQRSDLAPPDDEPPPR